MTHGWMVMERSTCAQSVPAGVGTMETSMWVYGFLVFVMAAFVLYSWCQMLVI